MKISNYAVQLSLLVFSFCLISCTKNATIEDISIENFSITHAKPLNEDYPFADTTFNKDASVLNYNFARKFALIKMVGTKQIDEMHWTGATFSRVAYYYLRL